MTSHCYRIRSALLVLVCIACTESRDAPDAGPSCEGVVCREREVCELGACRCDPAQSTTTDALDLVLMMDSSGSLEAEQTRFVAALPRFFRALTSGDHDEDGTPEHTPVRSLHVGVVTSDMGSAGFPIPTCGTEFGDDGRFVRSASASLGGCPATYPTFFEFAAGDDVSALANDVSCVAQTEHLEGCGFEQPLESVLKALSPAVPTEWTAEGFEPPTFLDGTLGHGAGMHAGFSRRDAVLAILLLTDEDDCSVSDVELFDQTSPRYGGELSFRCVAHQSALHPFARYVGGLASLRRHPGRVVLGVLAGIPAEVIPSAPGEPEDYDWILTHPDMQSAIDATTGRIRHSCEDAALGATHPPARIVQVAQGLSYSGARTFVRTMCSAEGAPAEIHVQPALDALLFEVDRAMATPTCD
ncbi:hypothetical protein [Sandaracinus amylolyticus]|uniref:hypothetical protein n=1 Tax=Sandaracinus amylolyticus TaxID=927083 RepID=UPI001F25C972|nr:hypothetical protein [Sandaracinus amylolyticus]UJR84042.1 Hypothetical protein I5071_61130 [Sandaracinus amylolyticus]